MSTVLEERLCQPRSIQFSILLNMDRQTDRDRIKDKMKKETGTKLRTISSKAASSFLDLPYLS